MFRRTLENVRKFGMEYCDLPTVTWNISVLLRVSTINIDSKNKKPIHIFWYIWTLITMLCYSYTFVFSMPWFIFWHTRETGNYLAAVCIFSVMVASEIGTFKMFYIHYQSHIIMKTVDEYIACDAKVMPKSRFSKNIQVIMRQVKRRAILCWVFVITDSIIYFLKPILQPGRHFMNDGLLLYGLEPISDTPNYEIGYALIFGSLFFCCYPAATVSVFLIIIAGYTEAQIRALSEEILSLWNDAEEYYLEHSTAEINTGRTMTDYNVDDNKRKILNMYIKERLNDIVNIHVTNKKLLRQVEKIFRGAAVVEFLLLGIGMVCDLLAGLENTYLEISFAFMQVMMDCITGQRILDASNQFENAVYDCKWEYFDNDNMKTVLMILQNSQRSLTLSAGGVVSLSFQCLMSIIRVVYSAYTALKSTVNFN